MNLQHLGTYRQYWLEACLTPQAAARILSDGCFGSSPVYFCVDAVAGRRGTFLSRMPGEKTLSASRRGASVTLRASDNRRLVRTPMRSLARHTDNSSCRSRSVSFSN